MSRLETPVLEPVRAAIAFARANVMRVIGVLSAFMLMNVAAAVTGRSAVGLLVAALGVVVGVMAQGALLRLAFADEHAQEPEFRVGPSGFQFGRPELRLIGAALLLMFLAGLAFLLLLFLAFMFTIATMALGHAKVVIPAANAQLPPEAQRIVSVLMTVFVVFGVWIGMRVCLYPAATIAERKIQVFSTWRLTEGRFWQIFAAFLLLGAPAIVLLVLEVYVSAPGAQLGLAFASAAVNAFVEAPLLCGFYAHLYKTLRNGAAPAVFTPTGGVGLAGPWG